jgi:hypothetical protein
MICVANYDHNTNSTRPYLKSKYVFSTVQFGHCVYLVLCVVISHAVWNLTLPM